MRCANLSKHKNEKKIILGGDVERFVPARNRKHCPVQDIKKKDSSIDIDG